MAAFSRLQLAAALIEYDNDSGDPSTYRSAQESALFAHLRRPTGLIAGRGESTRRGTSYLSVALPSETGSGSGDNRRRSRGSIDALRNPFNTDGADEEEVEEEDLEVDLASWGLDSFIPKDKASKASKGNTKSRSDIFPNPHPTSPINDVSFSAKPSRLRASSVGDFGAGGAFLDARMSTSDLRRNSTGNLLDEASNSKLEHTPRSRRNSEHALIESLPLQLPLHSPHAFDAEGRDTIPFPSSRPLTEGVRGLDVQPTSRARGINESQAHTHSNATFASKLLSSEDPNPFTLELPPPSRASRFDPKVQEHLRTFSNATVLSNGPPQLLNDATQAAALRPGSRASYLDPQDIHVRRQSNASWGTQQLVDEDMQSAISGDHDRRRVYSRLELMRPKVLIMPSPLQSAVVAPTRSPKKAPDGFEVSADGPPLPPNARSSRPVSMFRSLTSSDVLVASNSLTPNPRLSLSASQLIFRNNLMVGGQRDVSYNDIDGNMRRAHEDGEKVEWPEEPETVPRPIETPVMVSVEEEIKPRRPPGKLFGRSLIDDLEHRKAEMRSKQRVFTGDKRPAMMDRGQIRRSSTLIDPLSLQQRPVSQHMNSFNSEPGLNRRGSRNSKPLLNFDDGAPGEARLRMTATKSVFGVDTLWEREVAKLKEIEAQEKLEAEERKVQEEAAEAKKPRKKKKKGKYEEETIDLPPTADAGFPLSPTIASELPILPDIPQTTTRKRTNPPSRSVNSDEESSSSEIGEPIEPDGRTAAAQGWISDDEEPAPIRTSGIGPRQLERGRSPHRMTGGNEDSDEDLPLSATLQRVMRKLTLTSPDKADNSDDEDKPLAALLNKPVSTAVAVSPSLSFPTNEDQEDNEPLGVRASRILPTGMSSGSIVPRGDDDNRPLGLHPQQQRRTQYQLFAHQQQAMYQAQLRNTMAFGAPPSMLGSAFSPFVPPVQPFMQPMVATPMSPPQQMEEVAKFGRVDRWRRDVAVEGQQ